MRTRKSSAIAAASLVALASVFVAPAPAQAAITTYISVLKKPGETQTMVLSLDYYTSSALDGTLAVIWPKVSLPDVAYWTITRTSTTSDGAGVYELKNAHSLMCLDMATDGPVGNGTRVQQWTCRGTANQRWIARPVVSGNNWVKLVNQQSGLCLDVTDLNYAQNTRLQVWSCAGNWNQRWNIY
ncbi:RICIN domain-containing protein [Microbispora sp. H13382]|uniref:RICIN domain-containing protein n=1 Tax=Microbispora sp. H13382 TaxID=2729112 RepID=UPI0016021849|nr:RICIN domain-containing protein [Microbispora sp. H13382]